MVLLLVDDNRQMRQWTRELLEDLADDIFECSDGDEALACYVKHQPDWVLMDVQMERMDGLTATRQIKASFPQARVLIVTHFNDAQMREAARDAGAVTLVNKDNLIDVRNILAAKD